nr:hypothetical protein [uncultured Roseibium sp.]
MPLTNTHFEKLAQLRNRDLLNALLVADKFGYEDLARQTRRSAASLRVQFHRWESLGLTLLEQCGTVTEDGPGRNPRLFQLNPRLRDYVERALEKIHLQCPELPKRDSLPDIKSAEASLLRAMSGRELDLSEMFHTATRALERLNRVESTIAGRSSEELGFHVSDKLRQDLIGQKVSAEMLIKSVLKQIENKPEEINEKEDRALWYAKKNEDEGPARMAYYFAEIPDRSVSGFGGILSARMKHKLCNAIDDYLNPRTPDFSPGGRLRTGFVHVLKESLELEKIDSNWRGIVDRLWEGADRCTPIRDLPELLQMQKAIEDRAAEDNPDVVDFSHDGIASRDSEGPVPETVIEDIAALENMPRARIPESRDRAMEEAFREPLKELLRKLPLPDIAVFAR